MDAFTPQQTIELVSRIGTKKAHMRLDKLWWNSFMTGPLLGFGCAVLVSTNAAPWYQENAPGLISEFARLCVDVCSPSLTFGRDYWRTHVPGRPCHDSLVRCRSDYKQLYGMCYHFWCKAPI